MSLEAAMRLSFEGQVCILTNVFAQHLMSGKQKIALTCLYHSAASVAFHEVDVALRNLDDQWAIFSQRNVHPVVVVFLNRELNT